MNDNNRSKEDLIDELNYLRKRNLELETYSAQKFPDKSLEALHQSEERFRALVAETTPIGAGVSSMDGVLRYVNPSLEKILGYGKGELNGKKATDVWWNKGDRKAWLDIMKQHGTVMDFQAKLRKKDGTSVWASIGGAQILFGNEPVVMSTIQDITERKQAEEALRESEAQFRSVLDNSIDVIYRYNMQTGHFEYVSPSAETVMGYTPEKYMAMSFEEALAMIHPDDLPAMRTALVQLNETGKAEAIYRQRAKSGEYRWISNYMSLTLDSAGQPIYGNGNIRDMTARMWVEVELRRSKERFHNIFSNNMVPMAIWKKSGEIVKANEALLDLIGYTCAEVEDGLVRWTELTPPEYAERDLRAIAEIDEKGFCTPYKKLYCHKDGHLIPILFGGGVFDDNEGTGVLFAIDLTEQNRMEQALRDSEKAVHDKNEALQKSIEMKDEFLTIISHEFKTPLTVINSAVQTMKLICRNELSEKANQYLGKILQNSNRQLKLVNNLLDITRINAGNIKINLANIDIVILTKTITESIKIFAEQKGIRLSFSSTLGRKIIAMDEENYERILLNLISNAIKFTPRGKSIFVRASQKVVRGKCNVCIQVKDEGIGIPQDKQQLIFERFGQVDSSLSRQAEGTGIGLSLVKMLVEIMGGEITVTSVVGKGSMFTVLLPVTRIKETPSNMLQGINDNRLIRSTAIEFSDIY